jgi:hypothetical protein
MPARSRCLATTPHIDLCALLYKARHIISKYLRSSEDARTIARISCRRCCELGNSISTMTACGTQSLIAGGFIDYAPSSYSDLHLIKLPMSTPLLHRPGKVHDPALPDRRLTILRHAHMVISSRHLQRFTLQSIVAWSTYGYRIEERSNLRHLHAPSLFRGGHRLYNGPLRIAGCAFDTLCNNASDMLTQHINDVHVIRRCTRLGGILPEEVGEPIRANAM